MDTFSENTRFIKKSGFTLVEVLIVVIIIGTLFAAIASVFNPFAQIEKAKNANRQHDLNQIKTALDTYFNDTGCYPTTLSFRNKFSSGTSIYMEKVPEDPDCFSSNASYCYLYQTDGSACPQWNILYAQMHAPIDSGIGGCIVATAPNCLPMGGMGGYNYCQVSGKLLCTYLSQNPLPTVIPPPITPYPTPTPTPIPLSCQGQLSACSNGICDVEQASQCSGCGGSMHCYQDLQCGGVHC